MPVSQLLEVVLLLELIDWDCLEIMHVILLEIQDILFIWKLTGHSLMVNFSIAMLKVTQKQREK